MAFGPALRLYSMHFEMIAANSSGICPVFNTRSSSLAYSSRSNSFCTSANAHEQ